MPANDHLRGSLAVRNGRARNLGTLEQVALALAERPPCLDGDPALCTKLAKLAALVQRMQLNLVHGRHDAGLVQQFAQVRDLEVRDAN